MRREAFEGLAPIKSSLIVVVVVVVILTARRGTPGSRGGGKAFFLFAPRSLRRRGMGPAWPEAAGGGPGRRRGMAGPGGPGLTPKANACHLGFADKDGTREWGWEDQRALVSERASVLYWSSAKGPSSSRVRRRGRLPPSREGEPSNRQSRERSGERGPGFPDRLDTEGSSELQEIMRRRKEKIAAAGSDSGVESFDEGSGH
ncbi:uncharacterized protein LOC119946696 [Tachyglossus aculeatus]|uniref:uncharacterized protein LOC119946667 n=1 Tax=Tachyglossus aculeatus TaxID=9261 RepID=UPI0018F575A6|nr:uncharacterized protein LOC119946667 [Tachyglossus aculeatus]XP_038624023.1 uncharacterized protein LOC119946677 [Tachyglossus aculeatus]XP_038624044.1 uncharacterized protein LOC119946696 [Tachyglossus aculeatus]